MYFLAGILQILDTTGLNNLWPIIAIVIGVVLLISPDGATKIVGGSLAFTGALLGIHKLNLVSQNTNDAALSLVLIIAGLGLAVAAGSYFSKKQL